LANFVVGVATQGITPVLTPAEFEKEIKPLKVEAVFDPARRSGCRLTNDGKRALNENDRDTPQLRDLENYLKDRDVDSEIIRPDLVDSSTQLTELSEKCQTMSDYDLLSLRPVLSDLGHRLGNK
jgi:hypothetical protein